LISEQLADLLQGLARGTTDAMELETALRRLGRSRVCDECWPLPPPDPLRVTVLRSLLRLQGRKSGFRIWCLGDDGWMWIVDAGKHRAIGERVLIRRPKVKFFHNDLTLGSFQRIPLLRGRVWREEETPLTQRELEAMVRMLGNRTEPSVWEPELAKATG
jgi:hypothetical protein